MVVLTFSTFSHSDFVTWAPCSYVNINFTLRLILHFKKYSLRLSRNAQRDTVFNLELKSFQLVRNYILSCGLKLNLFKRLLVAQCLLFRGCLVFKMPTQCHKSILFHSQLAVPRLTLSLLLRGHLLPDCDHYVVNFRTEGHQELCSRAEFQSPVKRSVKFEQTTFPFQMNCLI